MRNNRHNPCYPERRPLRSQWGGGVGVLALLIVAAIILVLTLQYMDEQKPEKQVQQGLRDLERAGDSACATNRMVFKTNLAAFQVENLGEQFNVEKFRAKYNLPSCPRGGGIYMLGPDGNLYCTKHAPPPAAMLQKMIALATPTPVPTPFGTPTPLPGNAPAAAGPATPTPLPGS